MPVNNHPDFAAVAHRRIGDSNLDLLILNLVVRIVPDNSDPAVGQSYSIYLDDWLWCARRRGEGLRNDLLRLGRLLFDAVLQRPVPPSYRAVAAMLEAGLRAHDPGSYIWANPEMLSD